MKQEGQGFILFCWILAILNKVLSWDWVLQCNLLAKDKLLDMVKKNNDVRRHV